VKRFHWKLQRVLDVKQQRRRALQSDLFLLAQQVAQVREQTLERRTRLRVILEELGGRRLADRIAAQAVFMQFVGVEEAAIAALEARLADLEATRAEVRQRFLEVRAACRMLTRLREDAYREYLREVSRQEQKMLDESAHVAYARREPQPAWA
jgi:flagellar biosynthesis chaperone FliJ